MKSLFFLFACFAIFSCSSSDEATEQPINETMYFPPNDATTWETKTPSSLGWNENNIPDLLDYLEQKNSKSFIVLHNGKIVMEYYFNGHTSTTPWYWASAGKTLTTAVVGIAEQENFINTNNKVSDYIGTGWTSTPLEKENLIDLGLAFESEDNKTKILNRLAELFSTNKRDHWISILRKADMISTHVNTMLEASNDPNIKENNYVD